MVLSMERWNGKVAVVTGASAGIGLAIVNQLVEHGLQVVGIARRVELIAQRAEELSDKPGKLHPYKADLTQQEEILEAFKWVEDNIGPVHILVNNAGVVHVSTMYDGDIDLWRNVVDLNLMALCIGTRETIRMMRRHNIDGHIVHINSIYGHRVPSYPGINMYTGTKHAVTALTEMLRKELVSIESKIKVSSVSPGFVVTEMTSQSKKEEVRSLFKPFPMLRAEDIADGVTYVLSTPPDVQVHELTIKPIGEMD